LRWRRGSTRDNFTGKPENKREQRRLVAETSADRDLVAALGTAAAEYGRARLGLHAGKKPVGFRAVAAVGLEGTLRHLNRLLLNFFAVCNSLSVYLKAFMIPKRTAQQGFRGVVQEAHARRPMRLEKANRMNLHKEWCNRFFISHSLEIDLFFRANIKPAYQRRILIHSDRSLVYIVVSLRKGVAKPTAKISSKQRLSPLAGLGDAGLPLPLYFRFTFAFSVSFVILNRKLGNQIQEGI
jgi:hypothetical protein